MQDSGDKLLLESYEDTIKHYKKLIKNSHIYLFFSVFVFLFYLLGIFISDKLIIMVVYCITSVAWGFLSYVYLKKIKRDKNDLKMFTELYNNLLKVVDYPKYIKNERAAKFKKLYKNQL